MLGAMLVAPKVAQWCVENVKPEYFWRDAHAVIFSAMMAVAQQKAAVDFVIVKNYLQETGDLDRAGGPAYLSGLADGMPVSTNVPHYVNILRDMKLQRDALQLSDTIIAELAEGDKDGLGLVQLVDSWALRMSAGRYDDELRVQSETALSLAADVVHRRDHRGQLTGVGTGLTILDEMTGGWQAGDLIIIGARPSVGKTSLATGLLLHAAKQWKATGAREHGAFFSLEMSRRQMEYRMVSSLSGVMMFKILRGYSSERDMIRIGSALDELGSLPIAIDDTAKITVPQIRARSRRLKSEKGLGLIVVDYIQLVGATEGENRTQQLSRISADLKDVAKELGVPVIVLSQLSRAPEGREGHRPRLSDFRESGSIEQDADVGLLIHRPDHKVGGRAEFLLEKHRNGPTGIFDVEFDNETTTFKDAATNTKEEPVAPVTAAGARTQSLPGIETESPRGHARARRRQV